MHLQPEAASRETVKREADALYIMLQRQHAAGRARTNKYELDAVRQHCQIHAVRNGIACTAARPWLNKGRTSQNESGVARHHYQIHQFMTLFA
jgi:hypothetical protein